MKTIKAFDWKTIFLTISILIMVTYYGLNMGFANYFSTIMYTAHDLLINTVFFIMGITVLSGAFGSFLGEFGILALLNWILAPIIKIIWKLPGSAALGALSAYLSDNPAIIALSKDKEFEKPALTNFGTSFGMRLVVLPKLGILLEWPLKILFGFENPDAIAFPVTALGAVGAAMALVPKFLSEGLIGGNEIAVFTAIGMCWSGFLSTHVAMMDSLGFRKLTGKAILSHSFGGIAAGVAAHYLFLLLHL